MLEFDIVKTYHSKKGETKVQCAGVCTAGEVTAIYGKSGIGKSSLLRMIAGLDHADSGVINFGDKKWYSNGEKVKLNDRPISMVFQDFNLFENMSVLENLAYAAGGALSTAVQQLCSEIGLAELFERMPAELSKGQQQKVAIVRGLCVDTQVLLLDEPFSALDDENILDIVNVITKLKKELQLIVILVTHRKDVLMKMADSVIIQETSEQGKPEDLLERTF